jgi:hypothetical protein
MVRLIVVDGVYICAATSPYRVVNHVTTRLRHRVGAIARERFHAATELGGAHDERGGTRVWRREVEQTAHDDQGHERGDKTAGAHASRMLHCSSAFSPAAMKKLIIAIDGPSGVGKGTVSRTISQALGYRHVDTGAMYRAVGWKALEEGIDLDEEAAVADLAQRATIQIEDGVVSIDGVDVTRAIRTPEIDRAATRVARLPHVRQCSSPISGRSRPPAAW